MSLAARLADYFWNAVLVLVLAAFFLGLPYAIYRAVEADNDMKTNCALAGGTVVIMSGNNAVCIREPKRLDLR